MSSFNSGNMERTYIMIKPDGVQRGFLKDSLLLLLLLLLTLLVIIITITIIIKGLVGEIISRFEKKVSSTIIYYYNYTINV